MGTPTEQQDAWVADAFGTDPRQYPPAPGPTAGSPTSAQDADASCLITVTNNTKSVLQLARQGHDFGDFKTFPASTVQPGAATNCVSTHTLHPRDGQQGCKGFLEWTIQAAAARGGTLATWRVEWTNPIGAKNTAAGTLTPPSAGFTSLEQIGQGDENVPVAFTLSSAPGAPAQQPKAGPHRIEVTIHNATDAALQLADQSLTGITTDKPAPGTIAPGQSVTLVAHCNDWTGAGLLYKLVPAGAARPQSKDPGWEITWHVQPGPKLDAESNIDATAGALTSEVKTDGVGAITFELSGTVSPSAPPPQPRIDVTISNKADQMLRFLASHEAGGHFDPPPANDIAPGAATSFVAVGSGPTGANVIYQLLPKEGATAEPENIPWWTLGWELPPGQKPKPTTDLDPKVAGITSEATNIGDTGIAFTLSGKASSPQPSPKQQDQRTEITLGNKTNVVLRRVGADRTTAKWDPLPPKEIAPGATVSFATITSGEVEAGLMYAILPADSTGDGDNNTPRWLVWWTAKPGEPPFQRENIVPEMPGIRSGSSVDKNSIYFELSGKAATGPITQPQQQGQRTEITLNNTTNMVLRRVGADRTTAKWDPLPPKEIAPGASASFATITSGEVEAGLMYAILPANSTGDGDANTPRWLVWWTAKPGEPPFQRENIVPVMAGIRSGSSVDKNSVYFQLSGQWSPQAEQKTGVTIKNQTVSKLRLIASDASNARFDPQAPKEIAPGDTVSFETFSKDASSPKLSYEVLPKDGATQGAAKSPVWTINWQARPGAEPKHSSSVTDPDTADSMGWGSSLVDNDGVSFEISTHSGSGEKR